MSSKWTIEIALFVLALGSFASHARADEPKSPPSPEEIAKAMAEFGQPGPEHKKLAPLAGKWTYTGKAYMAPGEAPIEMKGTIERKWILNGLFLEERMTGTGFGGSTFEAIGLLGFDKQAKNFTYTFACNMGTAISNGVGKMDASGKLVIQSTCFCPMEQKEINARDEIRFEGKDKVVMESFKLGNGKPVKMMEITSVRQK